MSQPSAATVTSFAAALISCAALACAAWSRQTVLTPDRVSLATAQAGPITAASTTQADTAPVDSFAKLVSRCAPNVAPDTLAAIVKTESSGNPFAIGVVGGRLPSQPRTYAEAVDTARTLQAKGYNFSMGLGQVNLHNLARYGESFETVFDVCRNLRTGAAILTECYQRAAAQYGHPSVALPAALSCYYSGDFTTGVRHGYVARVLANVGRPVAVRVPSATDINGISPAALLQQRTTGASPRKPTTPEVQRLPSPQDDPAAIGEYVADRPQAPTTTSSAQVAGVAETSDADQP